MTTSRSIDKGDRMSTDQQALEEQVPPVESEPDDLAKRLEEDFPAALRLEEGQGFLGTYVRLEKGYTSYGEAWIMVLADENGELHGLWLLHAALVSKLKKVRPKPGDRIGVKYLGKRRGGSGNEYADYRVVSSAEQGFTWNDVPGGDPAAEDAWGDTEPPPF
jgi:hypothetical protein